MKIKKYRKKPVIIEAMKLENSSESFSKAYAWLGDNVDFTAAQNGTFINVKTLRGTVSVRIGDYILKGVSGEFYPCKPDIFKQIYEEVR